MNFLELGAATAKEMGTLSGAPPSMLAQTGEFGKVVYNTAKAWEQIQLLHDNWGWMLGGFGPLSMPSLIANVNSYTDVSLGLSAFGVRFGRWTREKEGLGYLIKGNLDGSDEGYLREISFREFVGRYRIGVQTPSRPIHFAVQSHPYGLFVGPTPEKNYYFRPSYWQSAQVLTVDSDIPEFPVEFHRMIPLLAAMIDAADEHDMDLYKAKQAEYMPMLASLGRRFLPEIVDSSGPLA